MSRVIGARTCPLRARALSSSSSLSSQYNPYTFTPCFRLYAYRGVTFLTGYECPVCRSTIGFDSRHHATDSAKDLLRGLAVTEIEACCPVRPEQGKNSYDKRHHAIDSAKDLLRRLAVIDIEACCPVRPEQGKNNCDKRDENTLRLS